MKVFLAEGVQRTIVFHSSSPKGLSAGAIEAENVGKRCSNGTANVRLHPTC